MAKVKTGIIPKIKHKTITNMGVGDRFFYPGHASFMIMTDLSMVTVHGKHRLAVSENGLAEWLKLREDSRPEPTYVVVTDAKEKTIEATSALRKILAEHIHG